jgi:hypothetical protein
MGENDASQCVNIPRGADIVKIAHVAGFDDNYLHRLASV